MAARVLSQHEMAIDDDDDVILVRRRVRALAEQFGFDAFATAAITTATSELGRNVWRHGGGGRATLFELENDGRFGVKVYFEDQGPGIADLERVMRGGYSAVRSLGLGVSGSKRLVNDFEVRSAPGEGTCVTIARWK